MRPEATIVFTTHNRCDILGQAIAAAQNQSVPIKILVMDDASSDGTEAMVRQKFPEVDYYRSSANKGPCFHRNEGIKLATTEVVFPLDDDSILQSPYTIEQTLAEFSDRRIGAVAIPYSNILQDDIVHTKAPDKDQIYVTHAFVAASHAILKSAFLRVGGYREFFFYMGEEGDLCIRLLESKLATRLGCADPIHHLQPPGRISVRADEYGRQNDVLFYYLNAPDSHLLPTVMGTVINGLIYGLKVKRPGNMLRGMGRGFRMMKTESKHRLPVSPECFNLYRTLKKSECVPLRNIESYFSDSL
ncbi:glycosyltransferase family 2 protein [Candidatus Synechococcus calcipolaris G9]|uniref:Glycosyltransferase family 2 protein n=1 Tax=Candidatus Synechococcus calcipolaris G9 TaxID=1497997 RepID=A0ABT6F1S8_9SYNE|nr:glycosyltransferase family A protein [Candidatus Synechococcus calcipolaris]MDG2991815.1 glycosyltransferase family 2 protein [Candidatus Synechococcus calcipolaris G9]